MLTFIFNTRRNRKIIYFVLKQSKLFYRYDFIILVGFFLGWNRTLFCFTHFGEFFMFFRIKTAKNSSHLLSHWIRGSVVCFSFFSFFFLHARFCLIMKFQLDAFIINTHYFCNLWAESIASQLQETNFFTAFLSHYILKTARVAGDFKAETHCFYCVRLYLFTLQTQIETVAGSIFCARIFEMKHVQYSFEAKKKLVVWSQSLACSRFAFNRFSMTMHHVTCSIHGISHGN